MKEYEQDIYALCGALMPVISQLLRIDPLSFAAAVDLQMLVGLFLKFFSLAYMGVFYNRVFCNDTDNKKAFINGMAAPAVMLSVIEPLTNYM